MSTWLRDAERLASIRAKHSGDGSNRGPYEFVDGFWTLAHSASQCDYCFLVEYIDARTIKTPTERALRETIHGQGLSMVAMGKELREKDAIIARLTQERDEARRQREAARTGPWEGP